MDFLRGSVVKNKAGHDKDCFFVIIKLEGSYAWICDGKHRMLLKPKRKNLKHLVLTKTVLPENELQNNRRIRNALKAFNSD